MPIQFYSGSTIPTYVHSPQPSSSEGFTSSRLQMQAFKF